MDLKLLSRVKDLKLSRVTDLKLTPWQRKAGYGAFALLAFAFALRQTFPADAVKERLLIDAAAQGWQISAGDASPAGLVGVSMKDVTLEPRDGLRIPIDRLEATLRLWPLLLGRRGVSFDATLFEGRVKGFAEERASGQRVVAELAGVDLSRAAPLRKALGVALAGVVRGDLDLTLEAKPADSAGHVDLAVEKAAVNGGELPVPGMAGALTVPRFGLGEVVAKGEVKQGKLTFERLETRGDDVELTGNGIYVALQPRVAFSPVFGKARVKIRDSLWTKPGTSNMKAIVELALAPARDREGSYGFQIFGTVSQPQARMGP